MKVTKAPRWGVVIAGVGASVIGGFWLAAWWAGFAGRWSAAGTTITVKTNTALCLLMAGMALPLLGVGKTTSQRRWVGAALALLVLLIGSLTLSEHLLHTDLGIDQLLASEAPGAAGTVSPNRMGMPASSSHTLLGIALLTMALGWRKPASYLGLAVIAVNFIPAVGYLYGIHEFYTAPPTFIAWPTVVAMLLLGGGLVLTGPAIGPMALLRGWDSGGATWGSTTRRYCFAAATVGLAAVLRGWLAQLSGPLPAFITFYPAVLLVAIIAGRGPGIVATVLAVLVADYWFLTPVGQFHVHATNDIVAISIFASTNLVLCVLAERLRRGRLAEAVAEQKEVLQAIIDNTPALIYVKDLEGRITIANQPLSEVVGLKAEEMIGRTSRQIVADPKDAEAHMANDRRVLESGRAITAEESAGGRTFLSVKFPMRDSHGHIFGTCGVSSDITQRKRAEAALKESERLYRAIGESIDYGIWICDAQGRNTYASESFLKLMGITQEQCAGLGWGEVLHPDDLEATIAAWKQCVQSGGPLWYREHRYRGADGQYHPILACGVPVRNDRGEVTAWAGINLDISRMKESEEALRESNADLSRFNRAAVGRELRMVELKEEINGLCAKAGEPPRYQLDSEEGQA